MNILIVDDEVLAIKDLKRTINKVLGEPDIKTADNYRDALTICKENPIDVAFLDVEMPQMDGLTLAKHLKKLNHNINIVMVTAYEQYALDAFKLFASGYILKPAMTEDVRAVLNNLRNPVSIREKGLFVQCFGSFEVFYDGKPLKFSRSQSKEVFAYLIDRKGASSTYGEICAILWEETSDPDKQRNYFYHIYDDLKSTLESVGCGDVLIKGRNSYSVDTDKVGCDYYYAIKKDAQAIGRYVGEYMNQYSWAECRNYNLWQEFV